MPIPPPSNMLSSDSGSPAAISGQDLAAAAPSPVSLGTTFPTLVVPRKVIMEFCLQLAMGLEAGIPLLKQVQVLADTEPHSKFRAYLNRVYSGLVEGRELAEALATEPCPFSSAQLAMISAGASAGSNYLPKVFAKLRDNLESGVALRREVMGAMRYPMIVGFIALCIMVVMLIKVVPSFGKIFKQSGAKIPVVTQHLLAMSSFVRHHGWTTLISIVSIIVFLRFLILFIKRQPGFQDLLLKIPALGPFIRANMRCAFFQGLSQLLQAGVPLQKALVIVQNVHSFVYYRQTILKFVSGVTSGRNLSDCMIESDIFGPRAAQLVSTGEKSGGLGEILERAGVWLEAELLDKLRAVTKLAEPISVMILACMVGSMVAALFLPLFSLAMAFK